MGHTRLSAPRACPIAMPSEAAVPLSTLVGAMGRGQVAAAAAALSSNKRCRRMGMTTP